MDADDLIEGGHRSLAESQFERVRRSAKRFENGSEAFGRFGMP
jgi:hypothetical protein